jgi:hypothetical protein
VKETDRLSAASIESIAEYVNSAHRRQGRPDFIIERRYTVINFFPVIARELINAVKARQWFWIASNTLVMVLGLPVPVTQYSDDQQHVVIMTRGITHGLLFLIIFPFSVFFVPLSLLAAHGADFISASISNVSRGQSFVFAKTLGIVAAVEMLLSYFFFFLNRGYTRHELLHAYQYHLMFSLQQQGVLAGGDIAALWQKGDHYQRLEDAVAKHNVERKNVPVNEVLKDILEHTLDEVGLYIVQKAVATLPLDPHKYSALPDISIASAL